MNTRVIAKDRSSVTDTNELSLAAAAEVYAAARIPVFPLKPRDKQPLTPHGHLDATTDFAQVREWWKRWPEANIGIVPGDEAGFLAIDVDGPEGEKTLAALEASYSKLPETLASHTGRGRHLLFADPKGLKAGNGALGPKIDVRSNSGYIVAPPSIHPNGRRYHWASASRIALLPDWLRSLLANKTAQGKRQEQDGQVSRISERPKIAEGARNGTLASIAGRMRQEGATPDAMVLALLDINDQRCDPPLAAREVERIARSIARYPVSGTHGCSDLGNAGRFVELHGEDVRFAARLGRWLSWNGTAWQEVHEDEIMRRAFEVPAALTLEAAYAADLDLQRALKAHARKSANRKNLRDMVALAATLLNVAEEKLDQNPYLLAVANGTVDLRTGELRQSRREEFVTRSLSVEYDPAAPVRRWVQFIDEITQHDPELADFLQRLLGYCLTGDMSEQCLFIFHGHGANGKSTLLEVVHELLGPYAAKTPMTSFMAPKGERIPNDLARLRGARFVSAVEARRRDEFNEPLIKELTGGDRITARFLHKEYFEFQPAFKIAMSVNDMPRIEAGDEAMNRRFVVVPFRATFAAARRDPDLREKLRQEFPGILRWMVQGCLEWQKRRLTKPEAVTAATREYMDFVDHLGAFIKECCEVRPDAQVRVDEFYSRYREWLRDNYGIEAISKITVGRLMSKKGFVSVTREKHRWYRGLVARA